MSEKWDTDIRHQFPDWLTPDAILRWLDFDKPNVGDTFTGTVIARAPFGWILGSASLHYYLPQT